MKENSREIKGRILEMTPHTYLNGNPTRTRLVIEDHERGRIIIQFYGTLPRALVGNKISFHEGHDQEDSQRGDRKTIQTLTDHSFCLRSLLYRLVGIRKYYGILKK